jgi:hypothetical protein
MIDPTRPEGILNPDEAYDRIGYTDGDHRIECTTTQSGVKAYLDRRATYKPERGLETRLEQNDAIEERLDEHVRHADPQRRFANTQVIDAVTTNYMTNTSPLTIHRGRKASFDALDNAPSSDVDPVNTTWQARRRRTLTRRGYAIALILDETSQAADRTLTSLQSDQQLLAVYAGNDDAPKRLNDHRNPRRSLRQTVTDAISNVCDVKERIDQARTAVYSQINDLAKRFSEREREELQAQYQAAGRQFHDRH